MAYNPTATAMPAGLARFSELKKRLLFVLVGVVVYRIGAHITIPGVDPVQLAKLFAQQSKGVFGFFNMFSGGALSRMTLFALGVMPYISASIIIQLLTAVVPSLEQLKKEGELGQRKISQYTRYATVLLSCFQALGLCRWLASSSMNVVAHPDIYFFAVAAITMVTGAMFLMWLGEQMTERGVGNGISILIFSGIVSRFPQAIGQLFMQVRQGQMKMIFVLFLLLVIAAVTIIVVYFERAQRRIPIHYARRQQGKNLYQAQNSHLPLKINVAGVIPPIFATSLIIFPSTMLQYFMHGKTGWWTHIMLALQPGHPVYMLVFAAAIVFFCFFYTALVFNSKETATNLKKSGAFIPSIRPGEQTGQYIDTVLTRLTFAGAVYLTLIALLPSVMITFWHVPFYFGGTSLLIVVVVLMDFMAQVQTHMMSQQYESAFKKANMGGRRKQAERSAHAKRGKVVSMQKYSNHRKDDDKQ
jgi:preprotein translocase subunit SecY